MTIETVTAVTPARPGGCAASPAPPGGGAGVSPAVLGRLAGRALREEALHTPKPGLVDRRGGGAHRDMTLPMLLRSAAALTGPIAACAEAARALPVGRELRAVIGAIGRDGERRMLEATGGVNTHRGALWALGLLAAGLAAAGTVAGASRFAAVLATFDDPDPDPDAGAAALSHGARVRRRYGAAGAAGNQTLPSRRPFAPFGRRLATGSTTNGSGSNSISSDAVRVGAETARPARIIATRPASSIRSRIG